MFDKLAQLHSMYPDGLRPFKYLQLNQTCKPLILQSWLRTQRGKLIITIIGFFLPLIVSIIACGGGTTSIATEEPSVVAEEEQDLSEPSPSVTSTRQEVTPTPAFQVIHSSVSVREGPGIEYAVINYLYEDDIIAPISTNDDSSWYEIVLEDGTKGWVAASVVAPLSAEAPTPSNLPTAESVEAPAYEISEIKDASYSNVRRFSIFVTTGFPISKQEVKAICNQVVEDFKEQRPFNGLTVFVSDWETPTFGFTIGNCDYAPHGEWADSETVDTGDYSTHEFAYLFQPKLDDPEVAADERPSVWEFEICSAWSNTEQSLVDSGVDPLKAEERANEIVAEEYDISAAEAARITRECVFWTFR